MSIHVIHANSCRIMLFHVNYVIHVIVHSCQFTSLMAFIVIELHFMQIPVIQANSCYSSKFMLFMSIHVILSKVEKKVDEGREGQICLTRPSVTALLSGRKQKCTINFFFCYFVSLECMWHISDDSERDRAAELLQDCKEQICRPLFGGQTDIKVQIKGLEIMNDDPGN
jgi:hypothetical protein